MKFRVMYRFSVQRHGYHYTEWYDTVEDALSWVRTAEGYGELFPIRIENEDGEPV